MLFCELIFALSFINFCLGFLFFSFSVFLFCSRLFFPLRFESFRIYKFSDGGFFAGQIKASQQRVRKPRTWDATAGATSATVDR